MKKYISILLIIVMMFSLVGCKDKKDPSKETIVDTKIETIKTEQTELEQAPEQPAPQNTFVEDGVSFVDNELLVVIKEGESVDEVIEFIKTVDGVTGVDRSMEDIGVLLVTTDRSDVVRQSSYLKSIMIEIICDPRIDDVTFNAIVEIGED